MSLLVVGALLCIVPMTYKKYPREIGFPDCRTASIFLVLDKMNTFNSAATKLAAAAPPYPLEDLPTYITDDVWKEIRVTYGL